MARLTRLPWQAADWQALQALQARAVHAMLLHGAAGTGKKVLALDLARARLCESPRIDGHACGQCVACGWLAAGHHPDLRIVVPDTLAHWRGPIADDMDEEESAGGEPADAAVPEGGRATRVSREILIDQVRRLSDFLTTSTHRGGLRVVVLAPAERLNSAAANALLKMLEEPPAGTLFVLTADALDEVLPTIRSRCLLQRCHAPDRATAVAWLREQGIDDPEAALSDAGGSPLAAWALRQDDFPEADERLDGTVRAQLLAMLGRGARLGPAEIAASIPKTIPLAASIALFQRWAWDLLAISAAATVRYHPREQQSLARLARSMSVPAVLAWLDELKRLRATQDHPLNARMVVETALLTYADCLGGATAGATSR